MADPGLLSRYGVSKAQVRPGSQQATSRPSRSCGALVRPASQGAVRPASTGMLSFESSSRPSPAARPCSAPEKSKKQEAISAAAGAGWLSVNQLHELTQQQRQKQPAEEAEALPPREAEARVEEAATESKAAPSPRYEGEGPRRQLRRERRRAPGQARRNAAARRLERPSVKAASIESSAWDEDSDSESSSGSDDDTLDSVDNKHHHHHHHHHTNSQKVAAAIMGDRSAATTAAGQQAKRERKRAQNPFVEYEDREQRLQNERRWLQQDADYLAKRREELRFNKVQRSLDVQHLSGDQLFQNSVIYNEYSHYIRTLSSLKEEVRRYKTEDGPLKELALPRIQRLKAARALQKQAEKGNPPRQGEQKSGKANWTPAMKSVKSMQHRLQKSHDDIKRASGSGKADSKKKNFNSMDPAELMARSKNKAKAKATA